MTKAEKQRLEGYLHFLEGTMTSLASGYGYVSQKGWEKKVKELRNFKEEMGLKSLYPKGNY